MSHLLAGWPTSGTEPGGAPFETPPEGDLTIGPWSPGLSANQPAELTVISLVLMNPLGLIATLETLVE